MKKFLVTIVVMLFGINFLYSQVTVSASIDSVQLFIGQQTNISIQALHPKGHVLQFPIFSDTIVENLEIISVETPDTLNLDNGLQQITHQYTVTSFDSALIYIPGFELIDSDRTYKTNSLSLKIVDFPIDTTQHAITDIKDIYNSPIDWSIFHTEIDKAFIIKVIACILLAIILIAIIVFLVRKYLKKRNNSIIEEVVLPIDSRKAHEIAYDELVILKEKQLWQAQQFKLYYTELTEILRRYVYNRYSIDAMEQTTDDILVEFRQNKNLKDKKEEIKLLAEILQLADLVKFAKFQPLPDECERSFSQVELFVDKTKELPIEETNVNS